MNIMAQASEAFDVVAVYRYEKTSTKDLKFEKDEHLTILRKLTVWNLSHLTELG